MKECFLRYMADKGLWENLVETRWYFVFIYSILFNLRAKVVNVNQLPLVICVPSIVFTGSETSATVLLCTL